MATEFVLIICLEQPLSDMKGRGDHPLSALLQGAVLSLPPWEVKWAAGDTGHGGVSLGMQPEALHLWDMLGDVQP